MIVVDGEDLRRLAGVLADAAASVLTLAVHDHAVMARPLLLASAVSDPVGAARAAAAVAAALDGPHGLLALALRLEADAALLTAARWRYELVDNGPWGELVDLTAALALALACPPAAALASDRGLIDLPGAAAGAADATAAWLAPASETLVPLIALLASLPGAVAAELAVTPPPLRPLVLQAALERWRFLIESVGFRATTVDPVTGRPLAATARRWHQGSGAAMPAALPGGPGPTADYWASAAGTPVGSLGGSLRRAVRIGAAGGGRIVIEEVAGDEGRTRWIVELPGIASAIDTPYPQDLPGAVAALALPCSSYCGSIRAALDRAGVPVGADVMLVGHSQGGIVAMDLARDPAFNGGRVNVTHVVAAGSPVSHVEIPGPTRVLTLENTHDIVTHLDSEDSRDRPARPRRVDVAFSVNRGSIVGNHDGELYADQLAALYDSPNPDVRRFLDTAAVYLAAPTATTAWTLTDFPVGGLPTDPSGQITTRQKSRPTPVRGGE